MADRQIKDFPTAEEALDEDLILISAEGETYNIKVKTLKEAVQGDADRAEEAAKAAQATAAQVAAAVSDIERLVGDANTNASSALTAANQASKDAALAQQAATRVDGLVTTAQQNASTAAAKATEAASSAEDAASAASTAQTAAVNAATAADEAVATAGGAATTANEAKTLAQTANTNAAEASTNAKKAEQAAASAQLQASSAADALAGFQELIDAGVVQDLTSTTDGLQVTYTDGTVLVLPIPASGGLAFSSMYYDPETYYLHLYDENEQDVIDPVYIPGGGSGSGGSSGVSLSNETYVNGEKSLSFAIAQGQSTNLSYVFTDTDPDFGGAAAYYVNGVQVATANIVQGVTVSFDPSPYLVAGDNRVKVVVTDENGATGSKTWTITVLTVSVTATLSESAIYTVGTAFRVTYVPVGSGMSKTTHFLVDGEQVAEATTTYSGRQLVQSLTIDTHGAHDIDIYTTTTASGSTIQSATVHFCIAVVDVAEATPIITVKDKTPTGRVYTTAAIQYMVYDPSTEQATITQTIDGAATTLTVGRSLQTWAYKPRTEGEHALSIACGDVSVPITYTATELGYDIHPANVDAVFDFDPAGRSNAAADRGTWVSNGVSLVVDDGFDWTNGGYQQDGEGNTAFVVRAGHTATIQYNLFGSTGLQTYGASFKMIFTARNVRKFDAVVAQCLSDGIGLDVNAKEVTLSTEQTAISQYICEGERTELVYNITSRTKNSELFLNLQGIPSRFATYSEGDRLNQRTAVPLTIGSADCDVWLYRCKYYDISLGDADIMDNYIADAPSSDDMITRYERNAVDDGAENIITDWNASAIDEAYINNLAKAMLGLRVIKLRVPRFTTDKDDKVSGGSVEHLLYGTRAKDCWTNASVVHRGQGTSSNAYGKSARNLDIDCKGAFVYTDASGLPAEMTAYDMTDNSVGETYFNIKLNVASSENCNNAMLAELFNRYQPYLRDVRQNNTKVRDTMEFHPCVVFVYNESAEEGFTQGEWIFYGVGDFGNSKKNTNAQGLDSTLHPNECIVELCNNTHVYNRFKSGEGVADASSWESDDNPNAPLSFRYIAGTCDEATARQAWQDVVQWVCSTDRTAATGAALASPATYGGVSYTNDTAEYRAAKFVAEFDQHFESQSTIYHYLFTSYFIMPDNRAKNTFPHCADVTAEHPIWDYTFGYDFDTAMGINNEGDLALDYGLEDIDQLNGGNVFNAQDSVLWVNVRDLLTDRINVMVSTLTELFDASRLNAAFDGYQALRPERLLMADARRKYIRPYEDLKENGAAITMFIPMMNGSKELQRHYFLKYQSIYFASKHNTAVARNDKITLRGFASPTGEIAAIAITPYSDLYVSILFGSILRQQRCKRGEAVTLSMSEDTALNDTEIYIYSASMLEAVEGIASVYTNQVDFSAATKLRSIVIGRDADGYSNGNLTSTIKLDFSALAVLEELRIDHCPNLTAPVDVSGCVALRIASFKGTPVSAVSFAAGSVLEECYLEQPVSLSLRNMQHIQVFDVADNYAHLTGLRHENTPYPAALDIVNAASGLYTARIAGVDWQLTNTEVLNRLLAMTGYDENGLEIGQSSVSGSAYTSIIRQSEIAAYAAAWPDLAVTYGSTIQQYIVKLCDDDGSQLYLRDGSPAIFQVDRGADCPDPVTAGLMETPVKAATQAATFTYSGWDTSLSQVLSDLTVKATYASTPQRYTVRWMAQVGVMVGSMTVDYGAEALYTGEDPVRTDEEANFVYYLFNGWDKSTACVTEDMDVWAIWIKGALPAAGVDLSTLNMAQLYGIKKSGRAEEYVDSDNIKTRIPLTLGYEPEFSNVESVLLAENLELTGTVSLDTGVQLMEEDRSWTMVVDGVFDTATGEACMVSCFDSMGYHGFKVKYSSGFAVQWSTNTQSNNKATTVGTQNDVAVVTGQNRDLAVLRHVKGNNNLFVYMSCPGNSAITAVELTKSITPHTDATIMLGCDNEGANFATGILYRCKLWWGDLGDTECRKMAAWPREENPLEVVGTGGIKQSNGQKSNIDFVHAALLCCTHAMNSTNTNAGGWPASSMRAWQSNRYLNSLPKPLRYMLAQVRISSAGYVDGTASEVLESDDFAYIASVREMDGTSREPYIYGGAQIPWLTSNIKRIRFKGMPIPESAVVPTASSATAPSNPNIGDVWVASNSQGYIWNGHVWVAATWYWLRDASLSSSAYFAHVHSNGTVNTGGFNATNNYAVFVRLHI